MKNVLFKIILAIKRRIFSKFMHKMGMSSSRTWKWKSRCLGTKFCAALSACTGSGVANPRFREWSTFWH